MFGTSAGRQRTSGRENQLKAKFKIAKASANLTANLGSQSRGTSVPRLREHLKSVRLIGLLRSKTEGDINPKH